MKRLKLLVILLAVLAAISTISIRIAQQVAETGHPVSVSKMSKTGGQLASDVAEKSQLPDSSADPSQPPPQITKEDRAEKDPKSATPAKVKQAPTIATGSAKDTFVKKVISETWSDPEGKPNRHRIRIVEANFKYPYVRLEENVSVDAETGEQSVTRLRASVADHLMVGLKPTENVEAIRQAIQKQGFSVRDEEAGSYFLLEIPEFKDAAAHAKYITILEQLNQFIDYAEPDWIVYPSVIPNDLAFTDGKLWAFLNQGNISGTVVDADIDATEAWQTRHDAPDVIVAVTDTGIRYTHEDLAPNMWSNADSHHGYDAYDEDFDPMDTDGHGTHCAGIIGARGNNGLGTVGVAWNVKLMALRFLGPNGGATSDAITVINYARLSGADIINASWGGSGFSRGLLAAIEACYEADVLFIAAAGNDSRNTDAVPHYPSSFEVPNIVSVTSTDSNDQLSFFSNYGATDVDVAAPGGDIWSCWIDSDSDYRYQSGTSMAAPLVAGALALAKAHFPGEDCDDLITRLHSSVNELNHLGGRVSTGGRLNLNELLVNSNPVLFNDYFNYPRLFTGCLGYWSSSNKRMSRETDEDQFSPDTGNRSLWFRWTAPSSGLVRVKGVASKQDVSIVAFQGTAKTALRRIADNFNERPTLKSYLYFYVEADETYSFSLDSRSPVVQVLGVELLMRPENDMIADARVPPSGEEFYDEEYGCGATSEPFETATPHAGLGQGRSVWWKWTPNTSGDYVISTFGSEFDTVLAVYTGTPGVLTEVVSNDDRNAFNWTSRVQLPVTSGTTYFIAVDSYRDTSRGKIVISGFLDDGIQFVNQPESQEIAFGDSTHFTVLTDSSREVQYQWYGPNGPLRSYGDGSRLHINNVGPDDVGTYYVKVSDGEAFGESIHVQLIQKLLVPRFDYFPEDVNMLDGNPLDVRVKVSGTGPISLQWYKNGSPIPGATEAILSFPSASLADNGKYHAVAQNAQGSVDSTVFRIKVTSSPWNQWSWRHPLPAGGTINGMKLLNGKYIAYGNSGLLMVSDNGRDWEVPFISRSIDFTDAAYANGRYVVVGSGSFAAVSENALDWTISDPLPGIAESILAAEGVFVAFKSQLLGQNILRSTDGITWTSHRFDSSRIVLFSGGNALGRFFLVGFGNIIYHSSDGITWSKYTHPFSGRIFELNGKAAMLTGNPSSLSESTDGVTWTTRVPCVNPPSSGMTINSNGSKLFAASGGTIKTTDNGIHWQNYVIVGPNLDLRYASATSDSCVALGSSQFAYGRNFSSLKLYDYDKPRFTFVGVVEVNDTIWTIGGNGTGGVGVGGGVGSGAMYSTDGTNWGYLEGVGRSYEVDTLVWDGVKYWAADTTDGRLFSGESPVNMDYHPVVGSINLRGLAESGGVLIGMTTTGLYRLDPLGRWTLVQQTPSGRLYTSLQATERGFIATATGGAMMLSADGVTWTDGASNGLGAPTYTGENISICIAGSKLWLLKKDTSSLYVANTGLSFTQVPTAVVLEKIVAWSNGIIGEAGAVGKYSQDGISWYDFPLPSVATSLFTKKNTLLGMGSNTILQTGQPDTLAPVGSLGNIRETRGLARYSSLPIHASATDPENRLQRIELWVEGALVGSSASDEETFTVTFNEEGSQHIELRAYDLDGSVGYTHAYLTVSSFISEPVVDASTNAIPPRFSGTLMGDRLVTFSSAGRFSSSDRYGTKISRQLPMPAGIDDLIFGNDVIVAISGPNLWSSTDAISWEWKNCVVSDVFFQDGWFVARSFKWWNDSTSRLGISKDGVNWIKAEGLSGLITDFAYGNGTFLAVVLNQLHYSSDGVIWSNAGLTNVQSVDFASSNFLVVSNNRMFVGDRGVNWVDETPVGLDPSELILNIQEAGGILYATTNLSEVAIRWASVNHGVSWFKVERSIPNPLSVRYYDGTWACMAQKGIYVSFDGLLWQKTLATQTMSTNSAFSLSSAMRLVAHDSGLSLFTGQQSWTSKDGLVWSLDEDLSGPLNLPPLTAGILNLSGGDFHHCLINAKLVISNDGINWYRSVIPLVGERINAVVFHAGYLMAYTVTAVSPTVPSILRSTDGITWTRYSQNPPVNLSDVFHFGSKLFAVGRSQNSFADQYFTSTNGLNWSLSSMPYAGKPTVVNGELMIVEKSVYGSPQLQTIKTSSNGNIWKSHVIVDMDVKDIAYGGGHYVATQNSYVWRGPTLDSLVKVPINLEVGATNIIYANGRFVARSDYGNYTSVDGLEWDKLSGYFSITDQVAAQLTNLNGRVFLLSSNRIFPIAEADFQITGITANEMFVGVDDAVPVTLHYANPGFAPLPAGTVLNARGILSRDDLIGNSDDILMDKISWNLPTVLDVGGVKSLNLNFTIPDINAGGQFYVGIVLEVPSGDGPSFNNTGKTEGKPVTIREWQLQTIANGNGQIFQDFSAVRYPHKSRVSLKAGSGKGAAFAGWGGDGFGSESQITVLMNGDKAVEANFISQVGLQVFISGAGQVSGLGDGGMFQIGSTASLQAVPDFGWEFAGWVGYPANSPNSINILMDGPKSLTLNFVRTFASWKSGYFTQEEQSLPEISGDDADPDGDGLKTWQEYLHLSDPRNATSRGFSKAMLDTGYLTIVFTRNAGPRSMSVQCQGSRDLHSWSAPDLQQRLLQSENGVDTVEARLPVSAGENGFFRFEYHR